MTSPNQPLVCPDDPKSAVIGLMVSKLATKRNYHDHLSSSRIKMTSIVKNCLIIFFLPHPMCIICVLRIVTIVMIMMIMIMMIIVFPINLSDGFIV